MTEKKNVVRICLVALSDPLKNMVRELAQGCLFSEINSEEEFEEKLDSLTSENFDIIVTGQKLGLDFPIECGQIARQQCGSIPIIFVADTPEGFDQKSIIKNGYSTAFLLPMDKGLFSEEIKDATIKMGQAGRSFKPVYVMDLDSESELSFSTFVYLPLNKKHIKFSSANSQIEDSRLKRLKTKDVGKLHIDKKDMAAFYKYSADRLVSLGKGEGISETERKEQLNSSVRGLFTNIIDATKTDFESGKELVADCQKIVSLYITGGGTENWYNEMVRALSGASNTYDHAATVSTLAALFAISLGEANPEEFAMAGFLHDLGRSQLPEELPTLPQEQWTEEQKKAYFNHPQETLNIVKTKKMLLPPKVELAILQHHEMFNGKGFPKQLSGDRICVQAQVLSFVDQLFYLTTEIEGSKKLSIQEAFEEIKKTGSISPGLLKKLEPIVKKQNS
ncbi:MAG: HD domain-containing protein [Bdellovibrionales bacterium]|nr:HD domain-containing protein [Bdellovibrionales bacterium]